MIKAPKKNAPKRKRKPKKSKTAKLYTIGAAIVALAIASIIAAAMHIMQTPPPVIQINATFNQTPPPAVMPNITVAHNVTAPPQVVVPPQIIQPPATAKPKLTIIIDDVAFPKQIEKILSIPIALSPSFLPPKEGTAYPEEMISGREFYMVHLPLEAVNFKRAEKITLLTSDSYETILEKLKKIKEQFPHALYYNNHTGSKFTANLAAMRRLIDAMDELDLIFVDSRTTADTKAPQIFAEQGRKLLQRDVFLDNTIEEGAIKVQLSIAVEKAKEKGFAIAIGHPHDKTLDTIAKSLDILEGVEVVYLKDL
ncbi:MAG: divergent polysaccharide deacetylase family protein [Campylobacteraceae bacterium]|nr:divergent polysaccharide deacetylase family protein [Campylobacteraceae bacterium]